MNGDQQDFFSALQNFTTAVKSYSYGEAVSQANQRVQEIKNSITPDLQKRQAISSLADDMYMRLVASGADPQHAAAVKANMMPPTASSAEQALFMGHLTGDKALLQAGQEAMNEQQHMDFARMKQQADLQEQSQGRLFKQQTQLEMMKESSAERRAAAKAKNEKKPLDTNQIDKLAQLDTSAASLTKLLSDVNKFSKFIGPVAGQAGGVSAWLSPEFAAFKQDLGQYFDSYRVAVTGAGAGPTELKMLQANVPSLTDSPATMVAKIKRSLEIGQRTKQVRLKVLGQAGRDISGFTDEVAPARDLTGSFGDVTKFYSE
jgi:hypothetical protein